MKVARWVLRGLERSNPLRLLDHALKQWKPQQIGVSRQVFVQVLHKQKRRLVKAACKLLIELVAGTGFEPVTFGL